MSMITIKSSLGVTKATSYDYDYSGTHMEERKVTVSIQSPIKIDFAIGDYVDFAIDSEPSIIERFYLQSIPVGNRVYNSEMISYTAVFWWVGYELKNVIFKDYVEGFESETAYNRNTAEVYFYGNVENLMSRIMANMSRIYPGAWAYEIYFGLYPLETFKDVAIENTNCFEALKYVNTLFGLEWKIDGINRSIQIGNPPIPIEYNGDVYQFEFGKDKGLCEITRVQNDQQIVTRVTAYGGTRNIPTDYRTGVSGHDYSPRLRLPDPGYIDSAYASVYGIREGIYINDNIYPSITGLDNTIKAFDPIIDKPTTSTPQYETVVVTPAWTEHKLMYFPFLTPTWVDIEHPAETKQVLIPQLPESTYTQFTVYIPDLGFDINDQDIISPVDAKMSFTTGNFIGIEFKILQYSKYLTIINGVSTWDNGSGQKWYKVVLEREVNDANYVLPNATITPAVGDEFVLLDIYIPNEYIAAAEAKLAEDATAWLAQNDHTPKAYSIRVTEEFVKKYAGIDYYLKESNAVKIKDDILGADETVLIQGITISHKANMPFPTYDLVISDTPIKGVIGTIQNQLKNATIGLAATKTSTENTITNILKSAKIFRESITDTNGQILGGEIQPQSIQPEALSVELRSSNYVIQAIFTVNFEGDVNSANGSVGSLFHKDVDIVWGGIFDSEHRIWTIPSATTFTLESGVLYHVYVKCSLIDGSASWIVSPTQLSVFYEPDYYYFEWGTVLPPIAGSRYTQTSYGSTYVTHNPVTINPSSAALASIDPNTQVLTINEQGGADIVAGNGMDFTTNAAVTLGLPSEVNSSSVNEVTTTSHTHKLGNISPDNVVNGSPVKYGALYNRYAATDIRNIANTGWSVPTNSQLIILQNYLGGNSIAGGKLKETGLTYWQTPNTDATNSANFNSRGSGHRHPISNFRYELQYHDFWNTDNFGAGYGGHWYVVYNSGSIFGAATPSFASAGLSIRLIKDSTTLTHGQSGTYTGNDGKIYRTICIGAQEWLADNLNETKYRNGDYIHGYENGTYTPISNASWAALTTEAMCYYNDNEAYGGGETPLSSIILDLQSKSHSPVTIASGSTSRASIDANQILTITEVVDDEAYSSSWDGQTTEAPSKNAVFDKIDSMEMVQYHPSTMTVLHGTLSSGTVADLAAVGGTDVNIQELSGANPLQVTFAFSGVKRMTSFVFYGDYNGGASHVVWIEAYNYLTSTWDFFGEFGNSTTKQWYQFSIFQPTKYISSGAVQVRLTHQGTGIATHNLILDYVDVNYGGGGGGTNVEASTVSFTPTGNISATNVQAAIAELDNEKIKIGDWYEDIAFEFCDVVAGTAKTYTLDISATFAYNIISAFLETDSGTLTGVAVKIGSTAVTSLSSVTVDTAVDETTATGANSVAIGNRVYISTSTGYTGTPTLLRGKLKIQRT